MPKEKRTTQRQYIDVNVPRDREQYMNEVLENPEIATRMKIGTYIGLATILTGFLLLMEWFDKKLWELSHE